MRRLVLLFVALALIALSAGASHAGVMVHIDKATQRMTVSVNGGIAHVWPVSTGAGRYGTPNGRFRPQWMARSWYSTLYRGAPMPYAIFFHRGYAIHGTYAISRLGGPASHGCIRLHPAHAATLFALVQRAGIGNTAIVIYSGGGFAKRARHANAAH